MTVAATFTFTTSGRTCYVHVLTSRGVLEVWVDGAGRTGTQWYGAAKSTVSSYANTGWERLA